MAFPNINQNLVNTFNLALEIPLLGRSFTWSNHQPIPVLARLDRAFVNLEHSLAFPNTSLAPLPKPTSDHTPLLLSKSSAIPSSKIFRFENSWLHNCAFLPDVLPAWHDAPFCSDAAGNLAARLKVTRAAANAWARRIRAPPHLIPNCNFIIQLFDLFEEHRVLSNDEIQVRKLCREKLAQAIKERAAYWKQRSKFRAIREADANTAFHHAQATVRLRNNKIRVVQCDGQEFSNHDGKMSALTGFFASIIGQPGSSTWNFDAHSLFQSSGVPSANLTAPFTEDEVKLALRSMNRNSAPGPDGFGPSFYGAAWNTIKPQVMHFMHSFFSEQVQLDRINRSYMVLIPKKPGATAVDAFRPISLQNCSVKILSKTLTTRLQREIGNLIDLNQTGFLQGDRSRRRLFSLQRLFRLVTRGELQLWSSNSTLPRLLTL